MESHTVVDGEVHLYRRENGGFWRCAVFPVDATTFRPADAAGGQGRVGGRGHGLVQNCTPRMLTHQRREIEQDGLITRTVYPQAPRRWSTPCRTSAGRWSRSCVP